MEFILAKTAGFCSGVRRALNKTLELDVAVDQKVTTFGPLVHNPQVIELLKLRGVQTTDKVEEIDGGLAVIRAHGVPPKLRQQLESCADEVLDNTCPVVKRVQKLVANHAKKGFKVVIFGEPKHPEVIGLVGYAGEDNTLVIQKAKDLDGIPKDEKFLLVTQTTANVREWQSTMEQVKKRFPNAVVRDTMCDATVRRQAEILELCGRVDAMIVIGGKNSGNTRRLAEIARDEFSLPTWHIENEDELYDVDFSSFAKIGVTAGASTPSWSIDRVMAYLQTLEDRHRAPLLTTVKLFLSTLIVTNVFTAIGAGALCYVGAVLQGVPFQWRFFWLVLFYVLSMHVLNRFTEKGQDRFRDDPVRVRFYERHTRFMMLLGVVSGLSAVGLSLVMGRLPFLMILSASVIGVLYSVQIVPKRLRAPLGFRRLKDIAASKNIFVALAWAVVSVFPLFFTSPHADIIKTMLAFVFIFMITGIRSVVMDLTDIGADRLVGRETLPIVIGEGKTTRLLRYSAGGLAVMLFLLAGLDIFPSVAWPLGFWMLIETVFMLRHGIASNKTGVVRRDFFVDSHLIAMGMLALAWNFWIA
jgi:(E)-4-hydroxy-3-methyl-but-2-enyl pyrophosphate reductase